MIVDVVSESYVNFFTYTYFDCQLSIPIFRSVAWKIFAGLDFEV